MAGRKVGIVIGTRPEAVKLAPVARALEAGDGLTPVVISTGQHTDLLTPMLHALGIHPDIELDLGGRRPGNLSLLAGSLMTRLGEVLDTAHPDALLVQGDTTSALCGALAAFHAAIPVGHVEAGLRSGSLESPFPEEANRRMITVVSRWHFAPTDLAAERLRAEAVAPEAIEVTGNTVIDALLDTLRSRRGRSAFGPGRPRMLVTLHRRETQGPVMEALGAAVARIAAATGADTLLPLHKSPAVRRSLLQALQSRPGVRLCEPLGYFDFVATLADADLVVTDSGGVVEEASALGVPCLVCRDATERPEALDSGHARLVGTDPDRLVTYAMAALAGWASRTPASPAAGPFGDGRAADRIAARLEQDLEPVRLSESWAS